MRPYLVAELVPVCLHQLHFLFQNLKSLIKPAAVTEALTLLILGLELLPQILIPPQILSRK